MINLFCKSQLPNSENLSPKLSAQHKQLQDKYDIRGFPTVILIDLNKSKLEVPVIDPVVVNLMHNTFKKLYKTTKTTKAKCTILKSNRVRSCFKTTF